ncbi:hypothetical protein M011DRAFT_247880 [Sporormia fimetaria CBS 119925]|uniref:Uncharacterized protein n=1 Tax=Sporormia fimetaria CBS 119925 TaxID=1340428 RepID=A0A6A6UZI6_9PLEO|nr:hypothetical protein M011DRAFT_247880 [Sporormia fimetaria CBS 119925]
MYTNQLPHLSTLQERTMALPEAVELRLIPMPLRTAFHRMGSEGRTFHKKQKVSDTREKHGKARRSRPTGMEDAASPMAASTSMDQPLSDNDTEPQMILHLRGYIPDPWDKRDPGHGKGYWFKETWTHLPTCKCFSCKPRRPSELRHSATTKPSGRSS